MRIIKRDGCEMYLSMDKIAIAISKAMVDGMAREMHSEIVDMLEDVLNEQPMLDREREVAVKKTLRKMSRTIRRLWKIATNRASVQLRQLWMNRNEGAQRGDTSAVSDMMLLTMPVPPTAETAICSLWQRGMASGAVA